MNYLFGLLLAIVLYALAWNGLSGQEPEMFGSCLVLAVGAWFLEHRAVARSTVDFSCGFVFPLLIALQGQAPAALLVLAGSVAVRLLAQKSHLHDLGSAALPLVLALALQLTQNWPQQTHFRFLLGLAAIAVWKIGFLFFTQPLHDQLKTSGNSSTLLEERELSTLRTVAAFYSLLGSVLEPTSGWIAAAGIPLCLAMAKAAENASFRMQAVQTKKAKQDAQQASEQLRQQRAALETTARRHELLEEVSQTFSRTQTPDEATRALTQMLARIASLQTVKLLDLRAEKTVAEPLVWKSWKSSRPLRGSTSARVEERLALKEEYMVALPVPPLGVVYVGRSEQAFTKSEAGRLWFAVQRATPALLRAYRQAQTEEVLEAQSKLSTQLQQKVSLSSKLLEASSFLLGALTREQVFKTLETVLQNSIPHKAGILLVGQSDEPVWSWGEIDFTAELSELSSPTVVALRDDLSSSPLDALFPTSDCLAGLPLQGERETYGSLLVAFSQQQKPEQEQLDFLATCSRLVGAALNALRLVEEVKEVEQRLAQAGKMSAIGQLAAGVAHELNTPLATASLAVEAAMLRPDKAEKRLAQAEEALDRAKHIVTQLLDHSRYGEGERVLLSPEQLMSETRELVEAQLSKRTQKLVLHCPQVSDKILANGNDLKQILINLILNASDASPDGGRIELDLSQRENQFIFSVKDFGQGIDEELKDKVFQSFFTTKPPGQGTGLGLSVCRQLAQRHAGKVEFESAVGEGTTFRVRFPARVAEA